MTAVASPLQDLSAANISWYANSTSNNNANPKQKQKQPAKARLASSASSPAVSASASASAASSAAAASYMPASRKSRPRTGSASSAASSASDSASAIAIASSSQDAPPATGRPHPSSLPSSASASAAVSATASQRRKMPLSYLLPGSKAEPVSGVTKTRSHGISASSSNTSAISALQQPSLLASSSSSPALLSSSSSSSSSASPSPSSPSSTSHQSLRSSPLQNGMRTDPSPGHRSLPTPILCLAPVNGTFEKKQITVPYAPDVLRIGRQTNPKTVSTPSNGYFDSKVLSRQHAEIWATPDGRICIKDIKSSNGTFVNGQRLSPENQESEPCELRDNDSLELGIDIVSEDQKSIVHHKVSARVEYAGPSGPSMNVMDMSFGDIDPTANGGLYPQHLAQPLQHMRSRSSSNSSVSSNRTVQSNAATNMSAFQHQRHMNYWLSPISIEQVVKRLSSEMREAKVQSQELSQTQDFITSLLSMPAAKPPPPEKPPLNTSNHGNANHSNNKNSIKTNSPRSQTSHPSKMVSKIGRITDTPPAPPPSQPLPEKPRIKGNGTFESPVTQSPPIAAPSTREQNNTQDLASNSPALSAARNDSDMFATLIESLSTARKELDVQGARVKELEALVQQERSAREVAEEKVKSLEELQRKAAEGSFTLANGKSGDAKEAAAHICANEDDKRPGDHRSISSTEEFASFREQEELKRRLDSVLSEMDEMRRKVSQYKETAEKAEADAHESRKTLAEMIETLRREREEARLAAAAQGKQHDSIPGPIPPAEVNHSHDGQQGRHRQQQLSHTGASETSAVASQLALRPESLSIAETSSGKVDAEERDPARPTAFSVKRQFSFPTAEETAPYTSMMGVVLIGVGIMAYLNGWGRVDK